MMLNRFMRLLYLLWDWALGRCRGCGLRKQVHVPGCSRILKVHPKRNGTNSIEP